MSTEIYDPARRFHLTLFSEGETTIVDARVQPGGGVPTHTHPFQTERFTVSDGQVSFRVGRRRILAGPGEEVLVPPATKHSFTNRTGADAAFRALLTPGKNAEAFFTETAALANEGLFTRSGIPKSWRALLRGAELLDRYRDDVVLYNPPPAIQRVFVPFLLRLSPSHGAPAEGADQGAPGK